LIVTSVKSTLLSKLLQCKFLTGQSRDEDGENSPAGERDEGLTENNNESGDEKDHKDKAANKLVNQLFTSVQLWKKQNSSKTSRSQKEVIKQPATDTTPLAPADALSAEEGEVKDETPPVTETSKFMSLFKVFINTFGLIFLAEWGDRSQLATIVLASANNVGGIIVGGCLGHLLCTSLAVIAGALIASKISVRVVTIIGGCVFIGFAISTLVIGFEDPATVEIDV